MRFRELRRIPVVVSGSWQSRRYVTRVTGKDEEFFAWRYEFAFTASDPIHAVFLLSQQGTTRWQRAGWAEYAVKPTPHLELRVPLTFRPLDPTSSTEMDVSLGTAHVRMRSENVKADPRRAVEVADAQGLYTGEIAALATIPGDPYATARILVINAGDTEDSRRGRWRMRKEIRTSAPEDLPFLSSGYQTGELATSLIEEEQPAS